MYLARSSGLISYVLLRQVVQAWTPVVVKTVTTIGSQLTPDVTDVSRDGGYSALINGKIVWLYDDTECMDRMGNQLSFVSNTAAYQRFDNGNNVSTITDFGIVDLGSNQDGSPKTAILAGTTVRTGGWIPFEQDEIEFNEENNGKQRVAICEFHDHMYNDFSDSDTNRYTEQGPGTSPTLISTTQAFLFAPLVYVDSKSQDPSMEYQPRGMTLISITAPDSGPVATRQGDIIILGTEVAFGGFSTMLGFKSTDSATDLDDGERDVYLFGMTQFGLQLARVGTNDLTAFAKYKFWNPRSHNFSTSPPDPSTSDDAQMYLPGSFSSGSIFYSPYFHTFIMVYFNKLVDSTFFIRYLQLDVPLRNDSIWTIGGKDSKGIVAEDTEALVKYAWSAEQILYASPPGPGGFNYAGMPHPEFFNTQYYPQSLYPPHTPKSKRSNAWYGPLSEQSAGRDGKDLLLSWTSQVNHRAFALASQMLIKADWQFQKVGGINNGLYEIQLARVTFDDILANPSGTTHHEPTSSLVAIPAVGGSRRLSIFGVSHYWIALLFMAQVCHITGIHRVVTMMT